MGALQAKENIWYVGVQDPGLRVFDIIMHSDHGTSYNSYIVKGTEKTVLFETSKEPFFEEFLANIREVCDPASLDYIVVNHTEPDHTGSMKRLKTNSCWLVVSARLHARRHGAGQRNGADVFERNRQRSVSVPRRHGEGRD